MFLAVVLYEQGSLFTIVSSHLEAIGYITRMKERLKKASEPNSKGYILKLADAIEVVP